MKSGLLIATVWLLIHGVSGVVFAAGFDGDIEHKKQTRQPIPLLSKLDSVQFQIASENVATQQYFNQGIAFLHLYESRDADRSFFETCRLEPANPMAWWGLAVANEDNRLLAAFYAQRARQLYSASSHRERMWIDAWIAYLDTGTSEVDRRTFLVTSLDRISTQFPDDIEASAFLVRQFIQNRDAGLPIPLTSATDLTIDHILRHNSSHPAHHYKVLLWETTQPERAIKSADQVSQLFPNSARALTTAARLYSRLDRSNESLHCLEASIAAICQRTQRDHVSPVDVDGFVEAVELQTDLLAKIGRVDEAIALAQRLIEMPVPELRPAIAETADRMTAGHMSRSAGLRPLPIPPLPVTTIGQQKLLEILVRHQRWKELLSLASGGYFESSDREIHRRRMHAVGLAQFHRRDAAAIGTQIEQLQELRLNPTPAPFSHGRSAAISQINAAIQELQSYEAQLKGETSIAPMPIVAGSEPTSAAQCCLQPPAAPSLKLLDRGGQMRSLDDFRGKRVVLVFYLGAGCPHCIEQLRSFAPLKEKYDQAGLTVIAVSTDSVAGLQKTFEVAGAGDAIPFLLVSDEKREAFRDFGAYDTRDDEPLHGTFLIDPQGRIVWQNIRREPFMATTSLLTEAQRVFSLGEAFSRTELTNTSTE